MYASWEILASCNLACSHCYATYNDYTSLSLNLDTETLERGLKNLRKGGVTQINLEGGEPTLRKDLVDLVRISKQLGMETIVSTHGMFLLRDELIQRLTDSGLDSLSLSLDGATSQINNFIRVKHSGKPSDQFEKAVGVIQWYSSKCKNETAPFKLKINCVVRRDNLEDLRGISRMVDQIPNKSPVQLKLVQIQPRGCGKLQFPILSVSQKEFEDLVVHVTKTCKFEVVSRRYDADQYPFIVVSSNGVATIPKGENHEIVWVDGKVLNILDEDFAVKLQKFLRDHPDFCERNKSINTYGSRSAKRFGE